MVWLLLYNYSYINNYLQMDKLQDIPYIIKTSVISNVHLYLWLVSVTSTEAVITC
jgi:hypothetical protein